MAAVAAAVPMPLGPKAIIIYAVINMVLGVVQCL